MSHDDIHCIEFYFCIVKKKEGEALRSQIK